MPKPQPGELWRDNRDNARYYVLLLATDPVGGQVVVARDIDGTSNHAWPMADWLVVGGFTMLKESDGREPVIIDLRRPLSQRGHGSCV
jgi:hypothetical protein